MIKIKAGELGPSWLLAIGFLMVVLNLALYLGVIAGVLLLVKALFF